MTRSQLIDSVALRLGIDRSVAEAIVHTIFAAMRDALREGRGIELRGFGSFGVRQAAAYRGRNPRSGEPVEVRARRSAWFRIGRPLRARIEKAPARPARVAAAPTTLDPAHHPSNGAMTGTGTGARTGATNGPANSSTNGARTGAAPSNGSLGAPALVPPLAARRSAE